MKKPLDLLHEKLKKLAKESNAGMVSVDYEMKDGWLVRVTSVSPDEIKNFKAFQEKYTEES